MQALNPAPRVLALGVPALALWLVAHHAWARRLGAIVLCYAAGPLHGTDEVCGVLTSGGTQSCLLAVKTYRDLARARRRVRRPEMILPVTAHVAWFKASEYCDVAVKLLPRSMPDCART